jgi:LysM repeat protein
MRLITESGRIITIKTTHIISGTLSLLILGALSSALIIWIQHNDTTINENQANSLTEIPVSAYSTKGSAEAHVTTINETAKKTTTSQENTIDSLSLVQAQLSLLQDAYPASKHETTYVKQLNTANQSQSESIEEKQKRLDELSKNPYLLAEYNLAVTNKVVVDNTNRDELSTALNKAVETISFDNKKNSDIIAETQARKAEMRYAVVASGDSLSRIAKRYYGNRNLYWVIFNANPGVLVSPNHIFVGQVLMLPEVAAKLDHKAQQHKENF